MKNPNTIEDELDAIRIALYERTKDMSPSERTAYIKEKTAPIHKEFGITPISRADVDAPRMAVM